MKYLKSLKWNISALVCTVFLMAGIASCDNITISEFAEQNTGVARGVGWNIEAVSRSNYKETWNVEYGKTLIFFIEPESPGGIANYLTSRDVELVVALNNPQGYDLLITPEYTVDNLLLTPNGQRSVTARQISANTALVRIEHALIGEVYQINLKISMADGSRLFDTYTSLPPIVFNTRLTGPRELHLGLRVADDRYPVARWDITQLAEAHPGINRITIVFQEEIGDADWITAEYIYGLEGHQWVLKTPRDMDMDQALDVSDTPGLQKFKVRFPMSIPPGALFNEIKDEANDVPLDLEHHELTVKAYNFSITIEDKYGLTVTAGFNDRGLADEATILDSLIIKDQNGVVINDSFYVPGFVTYSMEVPFDVSSVKIWYQENSDYPAQSINIPKDYSHPLTPGDITNIPFSVSYGDDNTQLYTLKITRRSPVPDSRLGELYIMDTSTRYDTMPAFDTSSSGSTVNYIMYVPSTVNGITLYGVLPLKQEGVHESPPYDVPVPSKLKVEYLDTIFEGGGKGVSGAWPFTLSTGQNVFHVSVTPEAGPVSIYTLMVVKAPIYGDIPDRHSADLLTLTATGNSNLDLPLIPALDPARISYTVNAPYAINNVKIQGTAKISGARVTNYAPLQPLTNIKAGESIPVAITVTAEDGTSQKEYHVLVNRMLPAPAGAVTKVEGNGFVTLNWNPVTMEPSVPGGVSYELYYHTADIPDLTNVPAQAVKLSSAITSAKVTGLVNATRYYFWIRAMNGTIPGEWKPYGMTESEYTQPRSNNPYLDDITIKDDDDNTYNLLPAGFSRDSTDYTVEVPNSVSEVKVTAKRGEDNQIITINEETLAEKTFSSIIAGNAPTQVDISVRAHDTGVPAKSYKLAINRKLPAPEGVSTTSGDTKVTLNWTGLTGATGYEVYYSRSSIPPASIEYAASKWGETTSAATRSVDVSGLDNAQNYYFWVRAVKTVTLGISPVYGEWSTAVMETPKSNNSKLLGITVSGGPPLEPFNFSPGTFSYSLIIPNLPGRLTATGIRGEANQEISYPDGDTVNLDAGSSGSIIIKVKAHSESSTSDYTLNVYRMLPGPSWADSAPVVEEPGKVTLKWKSISQASRYEVYYSDSNSAPLANPPSLITVNKGTGDTISSTVTNLTNAKQYYFWVRAVHVVSEKPIPGEWSMMGTGMPKNNIAELSNISNVPVPFETSDTTKYYSLTISGNSEQESFTVTKAYKEQQLSYSYSTGTWVTVVPDPDDQLKTKYNLHLLSETTSGELTITVRSHDNSSEKFHLIKVNRKPGTPDGLSGVAGNKEVDLAWDAAPRADFYELYYNSTGSGDPDSLTPVKRTNIKALNTTITGLENGTPHYFWVRSVSGSIKGDWSLRKELTPDRAGLGSLSFSPNTGTLSPEFSEAQPNYTLIVPYNTPSVTITAAAAVGTGGVVKGSESGTNQEAIYLSSDHTGSAEFTVTDKNDKQKTYTVTVIEAGRGIVPVIFILPSDKAEEITLETSTAISWAANTPILISPVSGSGYFTDYQWFVDNTQLTNVINVNTTGGSASLSVSAQDFSVAPHTLTLRLKAMDGKWYSKSVRFTVGE
ncbi:hypothetical protein FACS189447_04270 [Spirochaetia bacterium]|nr:hypothetical protein FACS189447_04270 [Spirochaetia bacterium]